MTKTECSVSEKRRWGLEKGKGNREKIIQTQRERKVEGEFV